MGGSDTTLGSKAPSTTPVLRDISIIFGGATSQEVLRS